MKPTLYQLTEEFEALEELLILDQGEISQDHEALEEFITELLKEKTDSCVEYIRSLEDNIENAKRRIEEIKTFIDSRNSQIESFKKYIHFCMEKLNQDKFIGEVYAIKNRKPAKKLIINDESLVPDQFKITQEVIKIDSAEIKRQIKTGVEIEGVSLVDGKKSLSIGIKSKRD
jgi:hypothetical protein